MSVQIEIAEEYCIARLIGEIDHHNAKELRDAIDNAVMTGQVRELDLDFREVSFMDSSGIGLVMGRYKLMQELGGSLHLVNIAGHLKKVMMLAGLDRLAILDRPEQRRRRASVAEPVSEETAEEMLETGGLEGELEEIPLEIGGEEV